MTDAQKSKTQKIVPCLWFDRNAEEAAAFYVSLFEGSAIAHRTRFGDEPAVVTVEFGVSWQVVPAGLREILGARTARRRDEPCWACANWTSTRCDPRADTHRPARPAYKMTGDRLAAVPRAMPAAVRRSYASLRPPSAAHFSSIAVVTDFGRSIA